MEEVQIPASWLLVGVEEMEIRPRLGEGEEEGGNWAFVEVRRWESRKRAERSSLVVERDGIGWQRYSDQWLYQ